MPTTRGIDYVLNIGFGGGIGGRFTFGSSLIGGTDIFATDWTAFFNGTYDDVTDDVVENSSVKISRGLDSRLSALESGRMTFELLKATSLPFYDPNEPTSPLNNGTVLPGFEPMRPVRLITSNDGWATTKGAFFGFLRSASFDPDSGICSFAAEDLLYWLSRCDNPVIASASGLTSSDAVGKVLDAIGFTDPAFRLLSATPSITNITFVADGTVSALDLLKGLLDAEQGRMFIDGSGVFHFEDRYARERRTSALYSVSSELIALDSRANADSIGNRATVTRAGGTAQVAQDSSSIHSFGIGDLANITTPYLASDAAAGDLAALILMRRKDPYPPQKVTFDNQDAATATTQLAVELNDRVTVSGTDTFVERIEHEVRAGAAYQDTTLIVTKAPTSHPFLFGSSLIADPVTLVGDYLAA